MSILDTLLGRRPTVVVRPAGSLMELLDATLSNSATPPELHANASSLRSQIMMHQFAAGDPLLRSISEAGGILNNAMTSRGAQIGVNEFGALGRRQYVSDRRRLLELYRVVEACAELQTAILHLRNEIFRRGMEWKPAFDFKCPECDTTYNKEEAKDADYVCQCAAEFTDEYPDGVPMREPDPEEVKRFDGYFKHANYFGQTLEGVLRTCERDIDIVDDAFLLFRKTYTVTDEQEDLARANPFDPRAAPTSQLTDVLRLDPTLVQLDLNDRGVPGRQHHLCLFHRATLLDIPQDETWDTDWKGTCPQCGLRTYPVWYTYNEQASAPYSSSRPVTLYLLETEVCHWSRYSPSESYGWPVVFSIYEKALTLLGMDRFVYDYFFERRIPQGVVAVATSDTDDLKVQKLQTEAEMMRNPHYIPWIAIDNRNGQATMQYIRFGYTLDEIDYMPIRDEIRERIAGIYGVSAIWMSGTSGAGGLHSESVPGDTPIWVRRNGVVDCVPISQLMHGRTTRQDYTTGYHKDLEVLSACGWTKLKAVWRQMSRKPMYSFRTGEGLVRATGNHSMVLADGRVVGADQVQEGAEFLRVLPTSEQQTEILASEAWLFGFFAAEGTVTQDRVAWYNTDRGLVDEVVRRVQRVYGIAPHVYSYKNKLGYKDCFRIELHNREIAARYTSQATATYLEAHKQWTKTDEHWTHHDAPRRRAYKKVPASVLNASPEAAQQFLDAYQLGDGHRNEAGVISQDTVDFVLAAGLQYLYTLTGVETASSFRVHTQAAWNPNYGLRTLLSTTHPRKHAATEVVAITVDDAWHDYVYDIETESGTFVAGLGYTVVHNSQQIVVQSRVVEAAQRSYHVDVFPKIEQVMDIHDWHLELRTPEEANELATWEIKQAKATWASQMQGMGFGVDYDAEHDRYTITGRVPSQLEITQMQQQQAGLQNGGNLMPGGQSEGKLPTLGPQHPGPKTTPPPSDARQPHNQVLDHSLSRPNGHRRMPGGGLEPLTVRNH